MQLLASITETQQQSFEFANMPGGWMRLLGLLGLVGLCYVVVWLYRREARAGASARLRGTLAVLRCLAIAALAVVWLKPVIATHIIRTITARVAVLADISASMSITEGAGGAEPASEPPEATRRDRVESLLTEQGHSWLRRLAANNEVSLYAFGEDARRLELPFGRDAETERRRDGSQRDAETKRRRDEGGTPASGEATPSLRLSVSPSLSDGLLKPLGFERLTDAGQALAAAVEDAGESPLAAVVLITDGEVNTGMSPEELLAYARRLKAPVHTVGVGRTTEPPNIRIAHLSAPAAVAKGDPFEVRVELGAEAIEPSPVELELSVIKLDDSGGAEAAERIVATRTVTVAPSDATGEAADPAGGGRVTSADPAGGGRATSLLFPVSAEEAGEYIYRARLAGLEGEAVQFDNVADTSVQVLDTQLRVLLIAGGPTYDNRYVTHLLERDRTVDVSCWLQSADERAVRDGDTVIDKLPREPEELFAYDVILMLDPDPRQFDSSWCVTVRRFVDEFGGGLLYQPGRHYATRFLREPAIEDLRAILPVVFDPDASVRLTEQGSYQTRDYPIRIPDEAMTHPLVSLNDNREYNARIWDAMPGVYWYLPVLRPKPLATTVMLHGDPSQRNQFGPAVLMAAQPVGSGRTVFLGFDTTWRWRGPAEMYFNRFWVQTVRYLAQSRRQGASKRGMITVDPERIDAGEPFKIEARVLGESFAPWHEQQVAATIDLPDGSQLAPTLEAIPGREGWFAARAVIQQDGLATIRVALPGAGAQDALVKRVRVHRSDLEMRGLRQKAELLKQIANETGAEYVALDEAGRLPDMIQKATQVKVTRGPDEDLWDTWWTLAALATLLCIEWAVRRRNHLL